jgi:hypothetical protein
VTNRRASSSAVRFARIFSEIASLGDTSISIPSGTTVSIGSLAGGGFEIKADQAISVGVGIGSVKISGVQFGANGLVSGTQATYIGISVSKAVTKRINQALEGLFGSVNSGPLALGGLPQAVSTALLMIAGKQIVNCFTVTVKPKK